LLILVHDTVTHTIAIASRNDGCLLDTPAGL
jgi:hypothetical protein